MNNSIWCVGNEEECDFSRDARFEELPASARVSKVSRKNAGKKIGQLYGMEASVRT